MINNQSAASALQDPTDTGADDEQDQADQSDADAFMIPGDFPGASELKSGDSITLQVIGKDADGQLRVKSVPDDDEEAGERGEQGGMMNNFDKEMK